MLYSLKLRSIEMNLEYTMIISQLKLGKKKRLIITFSTQIKKKIIKKLIFFF